MSSRSRREQRLLTAISALCGIFSIFSLWYIASSPDLPIRCSLSNPGGHTQGLGILYGPEPDQFRGKVSPQHGDRLISLGSRSIHSFIDYVTVLSDLRTRKGQAYGKLNLHQSPEELHPSSGFRYMQVESGVRFVRCVFISGETGELVMGWLQVLPQPLRPLLWSLVWFLLQLPIVILTGLAYWQRPEDRAVKLFFMASSLSLVAYTGGNHWWVLSCSEPLLLAFVLAAMMYPAVLLHFFMVYPTSNTSRDHSDRLPWAIYSLPTLMTAGIVLGIISANVLSQDWGAGVLPSAIQGYLSHGSAKLLELVQIGTFTYLGVAAMYFVISMARLIHSYLHARNPIERSQIQWILYAGIGSSLAICYTLWLACYRTEEFAYGAARAPMMLASVLFMVAYAVGIVRYKLMLVDQVLSRGMWYYVLSGGLAVGASLAIALASIAALWQEGTGFSDPITMGFVLTVGVLASSWLKDRLQRSVDRTFYREKYPLDKALQRINRSLTRVLEQQAVAENLLGSCCEALRVERAGLYLLHDDRRRFQLAAVVGRFNLPLQVPADDPAIDALAEEQAVQRVPGGTSPIQEWLRNQSADFVQGLESDGQLVGVVVLGGKTNGAAYTGEDVTFITAIGRVTGVALHCAKVHADIKRLNEDLQQRTQQVAEQNRRIAFLQAELKQTSPPPSETELPGFRRDAIKGESPAIRGVLETVRKVAASEASVLLRGESGTGKELLARAIHENSSRSSGPLVSVHCASLSPTLLESELFGHVKGAFTDARDARIGRFQLAEGGTLFLDEIGDISLDTQIKLLRVLQERIVEPVGGSQPIPVDVRVVAATHQNLERLIVEGKFREDLYYRLNVISITLPPLRERKEDLFELALHFLRRASERTGRSVTSIDESAMQRLIEHSWPGNIRELQNVIERAVVLAEGGIITLSELPAEMRGLNESASSRRRPAAEPVHRPRVLTPDLIIGTAGPENERAQLEAALKQANGNKADAARLLGLPRSTYYSKLKKHGIE